jgi:hypothetical protein
MIMSTTVKLRALATNPNTFNPRLGCVRAVIMPGDDPSSWNGTTKVFQVIEE